MTGTDSASELLALAHHGLRSVGYPEALIFRNYRFSDLFSPSRKVRSIELAAFAQEPPSYRSACMGVAVIGVQDPQQVRQYRSLGAPQVLAIHPGTKQVSRWRIPAEGEPVWLEMIHGDQLAGRFTEARTQWGPEVVSRAKAIGTSPAAVQLDFFDAGLVPTLENIVSEKLDALLGRVLAGCKAEHLARHGVSPDYPSLYRLVFRLIAAKLLADRGHEGDWANPNAEAAIRQVEAYYFSVSEPAPIVGDTALRQQAWDEIRRAFHFENLSVEALAYVYENTQRAQQRRLARHEELVSKKFGSGLCDEEVAELAGIRSDMNRFYAPFYEPIIQDLRNRVKRSER